MFLNRCSYWSAAIHNPTSFIKIDVRLTDTSLSRKLISFSLDKKTRWMYDVTIVRNSTEWILIIIAKWEPTLIYWYSLLIDRVICIYFMLLHVHSVSVFLFRWKDEKQVEKERREEAISYSSYLVKNGSYRSCVMHDARQLLKSFLVPLWWKEKLKEIICRR